MAVRIQRHEGPQSEPGGGRSPRDSDPAESFASASFNESRGAELKDQLPGLSRDRGKVLKTESQGRPNLALISGLERFDQKTLKLLAEHLDHGLKNGQRAELAGRLVFPANEEAAQLYSQLIRRGLGKVRELALTALARFPANDAGAAIYLQKLKGKPPLTFEQNVQLYAARMFPDDTRRATQYGRELTKGLRPLHTGPNPGPGALAKRVCDFVRTEIFSERTVISKLSELRSLFGLKKADVQAALKDSRHGLSKYEEDLRALKLLMLREDPKNVLSVQVIKGIRSYVALENELHKNGAIEQISTRKEIALLFGVSKDQATRYLRYSFAPDLRYREQVFGNLDRDQLAQQVVAAVREEFSGLPSDPKRGLSSDEQLAEMFKLTPVAIYQILNRGLDSSEIQRRSFVLRENQQEGEHLRSPVVFVRQELKAFSKGEIDQLSDDEVVGRVFGVAPATIADRLLPSSAGLSKDDYRERAFVLALRNSQDPAAEALRKVMTEYLKERVLRHKGALPQGESAQTVSNGNGSSKVHFMGYEFDSCEEAACGVLMQKYLPGFQIVPGETFQVAVKGGRCDFLYNGTFIEYHPIKAFWTSNGNGSFKTQEHYERFLAIKRQLAGMPKKMRQHYVDQVKVELLQSYEEERKALVKSSVAYGECDLRVVTSAEDLYYSVIRPFGKNVPSKKAFEAEFKRITARALKEHRAQKGE